MHVCSPTESPTVCWTKQEQTQWNCRLGAPEESEVIKSRRDQQPCQCTEAVTRDPPDTSRQHRPDVLQRTKKFNLIINKMCGSGLQTIIIHTSYIPVSQNPLFFFSLSYNKDQKSNMCRGYKVCFAFLCISKVWWEEDNDQSPSGWNDGCLHIRIGG